MMHTDSVSKQRKQRIDRHVKLEQQGKLDRHSYGSRRKPGLIRKMIDSLSSGTRSGQGTKTRRSRKKKTKKGTYDGIEYSTENSTGVSDMEGHLSQVPDRFTITTRSQPDDRNRRLTKSLPFWARAAIRIAIVVLALFTTANFVCHCNVLYMRGHHIHTAHHCQFSMKWVQANHYELCIDREPADISTNREPGLQCPSSEEASTIYSVWPKINTTINRNCAKNSK